MTNRFFAVTGMHRSGTSLVARIINVLGIDLGPEDAMLAAQNDNPRGFWENRQVFDLHNALLAHFGGEWDRPPLLEDGWEHSSDLGELQRQAVDVVDAVYGESEVAGWKDPRGSLLLPFWRTVVDISGTVLCLRHPAEVAASLKERQDFDSEWSAYLWLRYTVAAHRSDPGHLLVLYADHFEGFDGVVERLSGFLGVQRPEGQAMASVREALDPSLRHHRDVAVPKGPMMERAAAFFELLSAGASPGTEQLIDSVHEGWVVANRLELAEREVERGQLREKLAGRGSERDRLAGESEGRLLVGSTDQAWQSTRRYSEPLDLPALCLEGASDVGEGRDDSGPAPGVDHLDQLRFAFYGSSEG